jgi:hypothetical protein
MSVYEEGSFYYSFSPLQAYQNSTPISFSLITVSPATHMQTVSRSLIIHDAGLPVTDICTKSICLNG